MRELLDRARGFAREMLSSYSHHAGSQLSAAIAYRLLFSLVPFAALLLTILDAVLEPSQREQFVQWLFGVVPGTEFESSVDNALAKSGAATPIVGLIAVLTLLWGASGTMASIRIAFRVIWDRERDPMYVRGKLRDFALVAVAGMLVVTAFAISVIVRIVVQTGSDLAEAFGWSGGLGLLSILAQVVSSAIVVFAGLLALYRFVPPVTMPIRALWPSALAATIAFEVVVEGYAVYATQFSSFRAIYGPMGAVLAFLLLVYVLAVIVLLGAEMTVVRTGRYPTSIPRLGTRTHEGG